jgi:hypothetical protein
MGQPPIGWLELSELFGDHDRIHLELEEHKARGKELKGQYEESQAKLIAAGRRVRTQSLAEARRIGNQALANRRVDPATGEVLD